MKSGFTANVPRFFAYAAFKGLGFGLITATWLIYLQQRRGLSLTQATLVDISFWIAATLGELPTGIVADTYGRKASLAVGSALMGISIIAWALAPTVPLIVLAYASLAIGMTFLSGADDAFFYETLQVTGRSEDYTRLVGRVTAVTLGATAFGNVASGLLASVDLSLPFWAAGLSLLLMFGIVLTFREPQTAEKPEHSERQSYRAIVRQAVALMRQRPILRSAMFYLTLIPLVEIIMETFFAQPQALALGVPLAGVGLVVMAIQVANMGGSAWSDGIKARLGEVRTLASAPFFVVASLILLAALQILPALAFIGVIAFVTAVIRPLALNRIQNEVSDGVRATILSMQSLMFTFLLTGSEPILGAMADHAGLPAAYIGLAIGLSLLILIVFWKDVKSFLVCRFSRAPETA